MTAPIFAAFPPEVFSALLSAGPGSGPLLAASAALQGLAAQYTEASAELLSTLGTSAAGIWEGQSSEQFQAAHQPFLAWLEESAAAAAFEAAQHEVVAGAYEAALASMPTLPELFANHAAHAALMATNFLGINTIPIALNEADYIRMWIQAATTMTVYQATSETAAAAVPQAMSAPPIMNPGMSAMSRMAAAPNQANATSDAVQARSLMDSSDSNSNSNSNPLSQLPFWDDFVKSFNDFVRNPSPNALLALLATLGSFLAYQAFFQVVGWGTWLSPFYAPFLALGGLGVIAVPLALIPAPGAEAPADDDDQQGRREDNPPPPMNNPPKQSMPVVATTISSPATSAPATGSAPAPPAPPAPGAPASAPPAGAEGGYGYAVEGEDPPGAQFGPPSTTGATASASSSASASAAALAASSAKDSAMAQRKQGAKGRGRGRKVILEEGERMRADGYMDLEEPSPSAAPSASEVGAGLLGLAGAAPAHTAEAAGFAKLPDGAFQTGPTVPMLPQTWAESGESTP